VAEVRTETVGTERFQASSILDELPYKERSPHRRSAEEAGETAKSLLGSKTKSLLMAIGYLLMAIS